MPAVPPIYAIKSAKLSFGNLKLFTDVTFNIYAGDKICLIGRNGSGKSTLMKVISGVLEADDGQIFIQPGIRVSYMPQEADLSDFANLKEAIIAGLPEHKQKEEAYKADELIDKLQILPEQNPKTASGGELKKASLAKALISEPDILLLDEPTNHLDIATIEKLEEVIKKFSGAIIVISHDKAFLKNVSTATFWLDRGILRYNNKGFADFENWQERIIDQEIIEQKNLAKKIDEETEWLHKGVTARRRRNMGRLHKLQQLRQERREQIKQVGSVNLEADAGLLKSKLVIEAKHINKAFGTRELVKDFSVKIIKGNKIGIVGPNGSGKTTLIKLLTKRLDPDSGFVRMGKNLSEAYFDQNRLSLDPKKTLWKTLCNEGDHIFVRGHYRHVVAYLKDFLFKPDQAQCPVASLSGGEKNRLMLAVALAKASNFLVLDEPTNDLDMDTLDLLQEVLAEYEGTILIVSHDRDFLDHVATSLLFMKGDGSIIEHVGSYTELLEKYSLKPAELIKKNSAAKEVLLTKNKTVKLSYNETYLLKTLPDKIATLQKQMAELENILADATLYQTNPELFDTSADKLQNIKKELEETENKWLEISIKQEELANC